MKMFIWICVSFALLDGASAMDVTACFGQFGDPCYSFNLTCNGQKIIRITKAEYGYKRPARISDECCILQQNDCFANYSHQHAATLYDACSARTSCLNNRAQTPLVFKCTNFTGVKYAHVKYDCMMENTIVDMCNASMKTASEVNIMFKEKKLAVRNSTQCYCQVTPGTSVKYELVDIRLFTNITKGYSCIDGFFSINEKTIQCRSGPDDGNFIYINSPLFKGEIPANGNLSLLLSYKGNVHPSIILASNNFEIYCQNFLPTTETTKPTAVETDQGNNGQPLSIILGVIGGAVVITIVTVAIIICKRRQKKTTEKAAPNNDLPNGMMNYGYESYQESQESVQSSDYDIINDESIVTYSQPFQKEKDDYSRVDLDVEWKKDGQPKINEEDSYNHTEFNKAEYFAENGKAINERTSSESNANPVAFTDIKSHVERKRCQMNDEDSVISSKAPPQQRINTVSLVNNYTDCQQGDIYDTPRSKDRQYAVVPKVKKEQRSNGNNNRSKPNFTIEESRGDAQESVSNSDYEFAKPIDF